MGIQTVWIMPNKPPSRLTMKLMLGMGSTLSVVSSSFCVPPNYIAIDPHSNNMASDRKYDCVLLNLLSLNIEPTRDRNGIMLFGMPENKDTASKIVTTCRGWLSLFASLRSVQLFPITLRMKGGVREA